jgi:DNA-binding MarR family transcriptional regulator
VTADEPREASRLLRRVIVLSEDVSLGLGRDLAVNPTDFAAMQHLIQSGPIPPSELARRLNISTAAVTVLVDRLVRAGHAQREPHPTDGRRVLVVPADTSVQRAMAVLAPMIGGIDDLLDGYGQREQAAITDYLRKTVDILNRTLERLNGERDAR